MPTLPKALFWVRADTAGAEQALLDDSRGLYARGISLATAPVPYACRYELVTDEAWATARLELSVEGAGWLRTARLERAAGRWRVTTAEQGDLDRAMTASGHAAAGLPGTEEPDRLADAIDVDVSACPLFNTLPIRRLGLRGAEPGTAHTLTMAWVLVPSLAVVPSVQTYTVLERGVRFESGGFRADLDLDADGYVRHYPGLATLVNAGD